MKYIFFFTTLFFLSISAQAAEPLKVKYGLYAGGFNIADVDAIYELSDDQYKLNADLKTAGVLGTLAPWTGVIKTNGVNQDGTLIPQSHEFENTWRNDTKTTNFTFNENGKLTSHTRVKNNDEPENKMPEAEVYADNPVDMLTALFNSMRGDTCATTQKVMDGKRRFDMVFKSQGTETLESNSYNRFKGQAEICEVEIVPVAGKWREKPRGWMNIQGQAKAKGQLPRMWYGKVRKDMPPVPVRMMIKTDYGTMLLHLKSIS